MKLEPILTALQATCHVPETPPEHIPLRHVVASDLMSDVLVASREDFLLVTSLASDQMARTADLVGAIGVVLVNNKPPPASLQDLARDLNLVLLASPLPKFEACLALGLLLQQEVQP